MQSLTGQLISSVNMWITGILEMQLKLYCINSNRVIVSLAPSTGRSEVRVKYTIVLNYCMRGNKWDLPAQRQLKDSRCHPVALYLVKIQTEGPIAPLWYCILYIRK